MAEDNDSPQSPDKAQESRNKVAAHSVRLPFLVRDEDIGLGDVIRKVTYA